MNFDLFSCTFEKLNNLKFNELRKFSSQFQVNRRWAKKREIIDTILTLRDQEMKKKAAFNDPNKKFKGDKNFEWISGDKIFSGELENGFDYDENNRRLTYSVTDPVIKRLTFSISKNKEKNVIPLNENMEMLENIDRRFTYNTNDLKCSLDLEKKKVEETEASKKSNELSLNIGKSVDCITDISQVNSLKSKNKDIKTCFTLEQFSYKENHNTSDITNVHNYETEKQPRIDEKNVNNSVNDTKEDAEPLSSQIKMLTIPYSRVLRQSRKTLAKESKTKDTSTLKISEKSIKIRKSTNKLNEFIKSPHQKPKINKFGINEKFISISSSRNMKEVLFIENISTNKQHLKFNIPLISYEKKDMDDDEQIQKKKNTILKPNFKSNVDLKSLTSKESNLNNLKNNIPGAKSSTSSKTITATKMPDFSKIHKKRFEQMDSLHDYQRKKEERAKKLFGIPQPGIPANVTKAAKSSIFDFKSHKKSGNQSNKAGITSLKSTPIASEKDKISRKEGLRLGGLKSDIVKTLKEENRKHLYGVRTNKRFELQMKYRNL